MASEERHAEPVLTGNSKMLALFLLWSGKSVEMD